jgi:alkanesulfonate monooxygenase SsuD/methylene tetrahydromethanopterin reductase-like flavin-dependent oxidoreductase (luciferase family)
MADGDWLPKDDRYRRTDEYLDVVKKVWTSDQPFDFDGEFYKVQGAFSTVKAIQKPRIPLYFGGASGAAIPVGAKHADSISGHGPHQQHLGDSWGRADHGRECDRPAFSA